MDALPVRAPESGRIQGVDVARGLASLIMIQGHAYDGWVRPEDKTSAAYLFTRLLGSLPLPAFLVLAGAAIVLRVDAAARRGESAAEVRRAVAKRGLVVLGWGYATNVAYALMDGVEGIETILRADVLQLIGLSIALLAMLGIRGAPGPGGAEPRPEPRRLALAALGLAVVPVLICPWVAPLGAHLQGPFRFAVALLIDVPGVTQMPMIPLASWLGAGALAGLGLVRMRDRAPERSRIAGAPDRVLWFAGATSIALALAASWATSALVGALGGTLSRAHPAVWLNAIDLAARGVLVLAVGALLSRRIGERGRAILRRLGQGSLVAYVFHIPFCYGRAGELLRGQLSMASATFFVALLMIASWLVVRARDAWRDGELRLGRRQRAPYAESRPGRRASSIER